MERWVGKVCVVTGTSAGIGAAIAQRLVEEGVVVVGLARRLDRLQALASELKGCKGVLHPVQCDLRKEEEILAAFKWVESNLGGVDMLVNNAGLTHEARLIDGSTEDWREILEVNVLGLSICTREAIKSLKERKALGHIIHINSISGHRIPHGYPFSMYLATKHAVTALAEALWRELTIEGTEHIKVTSISPGTIKTDILYANKMKTIDADKVYKKNPYLPPKDVADSVVYVLGTGPKVQIPELTIQPVGETF